MKFEKLDLKHKNAITDKLGFAHSHLGWEYDFANLWIWDTRETGKICITEDATFIFFESEGMQVFIPPIVSDDEKFFTAMSELRNYVVENGYDNAVVSGLMKEQASDLSPNEFIISTDPAKYDYIYNAADLIALSGKKYHSKRNFVSRFTSKYDFQIEEYASEDFDKIIGLYDVWTDSRSDNRILNHEREAFERALKNHEQLNLKTLLITINGECAAFATVSLSNRQVGRTFFEKADYSYDGISQAVNKFTAERFFQDCEFINREEDLGIEGLRKAKLSYNPIFLLEKYDAKIRL